MLKNFNLDASAFAAIADTPEAFENTGRTTTLTVGRRISFKGSINGIEVPAYATLKSAKLSRLSVLEQQSNSTGETYKIVTGILKPVVMDLEVVIDGQTMPIHEVLRAFVNENAKKPVSEQEFLATCSRLGLKFVDGMPLFFQQFGASESGIRHAVETFMANGAVDVYPSMKNPGRIKEAYAHETGVEITSFEVGTTDRLQSKTGQGFLNLVDASVDQFSRIVSLRKDGKTIDCTIHRLVAKTFLDCVDGLDVNHINGNRSDNRLINLELVTRSKNLAHGMFVNKNGIAKLTHEQAEEVKRRVALGERQVDIAKEFNVFKQTINQIVRGTGYKNSKIAMQYKGVA